LLVREAADRNEQGKQEQAEAEYTADPATHMGPDRKCMFQLVTH